MDANKYIDILKKCHVSAEKLGICEIFKMYKANDPGYKASKYAFGYCSIVCRWTKPFHLHNGFRRLSKHHLC